MRSLIGMAGICITALILVCSASAPNSAELTGKQFILDPVGSVQKEGGRTILVLDKNIAPAALGLKDFSHVWVFWWFDRNDTPEKRAILQVHPRGNRDHPLTGVFACRSPFRPNPIALTLCRVLAVKENIIEIDHIDAFEDTPILDLKPYIPGSDSAHASIPDWLKHHR